MDGADEMDEGSLRCRLSAASVFVPSLFLFRKLSSLESTEIAKALLPKDLCITEIDFSC